MSHVCRKENIEARNTYVYYGNTKYCSTAIRLREMSRVSRKAEQKEKKKVYNYNRAPEYFLLGYRTRDMFRVLIKNKTRKKGGKHKKQSAPPHAGSNEEKVIIGVLFSKRIVRTRQNTKRCVHRNSNPRPIRVTYAATETTLIMLFRGVRHREVLLYTHRLLCFHPRTQSFAHNDYCTVTCTSQG